ncbi:aspartate--tRNA ligase [Bacillaceae bacterium SIJ1]|uniref:aspartate--tRNA ligase n=1 Tax=Litoribacterium kuwaitense TaxID=1398745 RepID=UPI0013EA1BE1|nr:aspartate--tRNA ligase [Litoribacterium kuwaitense]NGP43447.1 aspartate--tRNA ligase [Litoribacterium kuwaitense]
MTRGRSHHCGKLTSQHIDETVVLKGWVDNRRDLGGVIFIDLRDASGLVQIVADQEIAEEAFLTAEKVRGEYVLHVEGKVNARSEETVNPKLPTGEIEVEATRIDVVNAAKTPPFPIEDDLQTGEDIRLKYRYIDLRRQKMQENLKLRHRTFKTIRHYLDELDFTEVETPVLTKSTPEGARDYLVPSRVHPGSFFALPQSPQLFKQLLMVSGLERYYQITKCFRDEDLRADRQPEFTQLDLEMSFFDKDELFTMMEEMIAQVFKDVKGIDIEKSFPRMTYQEAIDRFGSDKPDTRFGLELKDVSDLALTCDFKVFRQAIENNGQVKGICVPGAGAQYSRKEIDQLADFAAQFKAKGLAWLKVEEDGLKGPIVKFFSKDEQDALKARFDASVGDLLLFVADRPAVVADTLGALRTRFGKEFNLIDESAFHLLWITDWPLLEYDEETKRYYAAHHPFTSPVESDIELLEEQPEAVRAEAYDLVLNGYEVGGGSLRIHDKDVQNKMFKALGFSEEESYEQFGFLLDALEYGTPPHGGIAFGLDRLVMILAEETNLREVIAFPKTASGMDAMTAAPSSVSLDQLTDLHIKLDV